MKKRAFYQIKLLCGFICLFQIVWFSLGCQSRNGEKNKIGIKDIEKQLLKSADAAIRIKTARLLAEAKEIDKGFYQTTDALYITLTACRDDNPEVRAYMAAALSHINNDSTAKAIMKLLGDRSVKVRISALEALADVGNKKTLEAMFPLLSDHNIRVRTAAISALTKFDGEKVTLELTKSLWDIDPTVRIVAAEALGERGDPAAGNALEKLTHIKNRKVVQKAREALLLIKKKTDVPRSIDNKL